jgi:SMI1 / KNR4 family (SUKH-1)
MYAVPGAHSPRPPDLGSRPRIAAEAEHRMTDTSVSIWRVPAYLPYLQPALTADAVQHVEARLGVSLPESYLALLRQQNGGYICLTLPDTPDAQIWGVGPHYPNIGMDHWWQDEDTGDDQGWIPDTPKLLVPFSGDGHWHLCFDYRKHGPQAEPVVTYFDLESQDEREVSGSFAEFLGQLELRLGNRAFGIRSSAPLDAVLAALNAALGVTWDSVDSDGAGYPVYRWPLGDERGRAWAWLSPNLVPRGFVRQSHPRYAELADLLPGTALRYPQYPDVTFIMTCTDGVVDRVMAALQSGLPLGDSVVGL